MGSLLKDSFGKEVGKRKWCETFAGPLIRRLSRSGGLSFIFSKEMLIFCVFFGAFRALPSTKKNTKTHQKKTQFIPQKKHHGKKKTQVIPQKNTIHITKEIKKNTNHTRKKHQKQTQFIPQKKHKKKQSHFPFCFCFSFCFFFCFFSVFFFLFLFCFFSAFGKLLLLKHFQVASPAQFQPPLQPASPPGL